MSKHRVVVGLSGGVDSSVAAWLLKQQGHEVSGVFMKNWEDDDDDAYCSSREDWVDAVSVMSSTSRSSRSISPAIQRPGLRALSQGIRRQNAEPDVLCNNEIARGLSVAQSGADRIATGHYAGVRGRRLFSCSRARRHEGPELLRTA
jgi:tRNA-specific 2-thiouridylase